MRVLLTVLSTLVASSSAVADISPAGPVEAFSSHWSNLLVGLAMGAVPVRYFGDRGLT